MEALDPSRNMSICSTELGVFRSRPFSIFRIADQVKSGTSLFAAFIRIELSLAEKQTAYVYVSINFVSPATTPTFIARQRGIVTRFSQPGFVMRYCETLVGRLKGLSQTPNKHMKLNMVVTVEPAHHCAFTSTVRFGFGRRNEAVDKQYCLEVQHPTNGEVPTPTADLEDPFFALLDTVDIPADIATKPLVS